MARAGGFLSPRMKEKEKLRRAKTERLALKVC